MTESQESDPIPSKGALELQAALRERGKQAQLARDLKVGQDMVSRWCNGKRRPEPKYRAAIQDAFNIDWRLWDEPAEEGAA